MTVLTHQGGELIQIKKIKKELKVSQMKRAQIKKAKIKKAQM